MSAPHGTTVLVLADPTRGEPARTFHDVVGYVIVTGEGFLHTRHVDPSDAVLLAAGLRETAYQLEHYADTGTWPQGREPQ